MSADAVTTRLRYGAAHLDLRVPGPSTVDVLRAADLQPLPDPHAAVAAALDAPVGAPPLRERAAGARSACIVVCDVTRPVPNGLFLWPTIERLAAAGVPLERVTVLVATGLHRPNEGEELRRVIADDRVLERVRVVNHVASDEASHVDLGATSRGTPVALDRRLIEADLRVLTGLVEPHFMAGYSGGRKVLAPGVAGHRTIRSLHHARFMGDPRATTCRLDDNPLHAELLQILERAGGAFAINTVIDEARRLVFVNAGEAVASHAEAVAAARPGSEVPVAEPYDLVLTSAGGAPLDATYYQTVKGIVTPVPALARDGTMLVVSACSEGLGSPAFRAAQARLREAGRAAFLRDVAARELAEPDEWQTHMLVRVPDSAAVHLHSAGLSDEDHGLTGVRRCDDPQGFVDAFVRARPEARVAVIPEGPYVVPVRRRGAIGRGGAGPDA